MKTVEKFFGIAGAAMLISSSLLAGDITKNLNFSSFSGIESSASCEIVLEKSSEFTAKLTCDETFQDYVEVYAKNNLLHVEMNTKAMPAELKKIWKTKDMREPQFRLVLGLPSITSIELDGDAHLSSNLGTISIKEFSLSLSGRSKATGLDVNADKLYLKASGSSSAGISAAGDSLIVSTSGSSNANIKTSAANTSVTAARTSSVTLSGSSNWIGITCGGACAVNSLSLNSPRADVKLEGGAVASIQSSGKVTIDLKGSKLYFKGPAVFEVVKVINSNIEPAQE